MSGMPRSVLNAAVVIGEAFALRNGEPEDRECSCGAGLSASTPTHVGSPLKVMAALPSPSPCRALYAARPSALRV
jgi:hypothetical protein